MVDVIPVSDPNASTMAQKIVQYQAVIQLSQQAPDIYDLPQLHRQMLDVLGIKNADKLVPLEDDERPKDPVTENMNMLKVKPLKAFMSQDHDAHITVHQSFLKDPNITQGIAQNPKASQMMAAMQAHIAEHLGFHYRQEIEKQMGVTLPSPEEQLPDDVEAQLSQLIAQASEQLLKENQGEAQQQQAQQAAQDPVIQMQQKDQQLKEQEVQIKGMKVQNDAQAKQQSLANEAARIANQKEIDYARINADMQKHQQTDASEQQREQMRLTAAQIAAQNRGNV
jgi:hypothetical protein